MKQVSDRRQEKRDRIGARGPLCKLARRHACAACGKRPCDPAHLDPVGRGFGDWKRAAKGGKWIGRVCPLCRLCHRILDRNLVGWTDELEAARAALLAIAQPAAVRLGIAWAAEHGITLGRHTLHPYEQWRAKGGLADTDILD